MLTEYELSDEDYELVKQAASKRPITKSSSTKEDLFLYNRSSSFSRQDLNIVWAKIGLKMGFISNTVKMLHHKRFMAQRDTTTLLRLKKQWEQFGLSIT